MKGRFFAFLLVALSACVSAQTVDWRPTSGGKADPQAAGRGKKSGDAVELGITIRQEAGRQLGDQIESSVAWIEAETIGWHGEKEAQPLVVTFRRSGAQEALETYYLVPWQNLTSKKSTAQLTLAPLLLVVHPAALVFGPVPGRDNTKAAQKLKRELGSVTTSVLDLSTNNRKRAPKLAAKMPAGLQVMSLTGRRHLVTIEVALPGSRIPPGDKICRVAPGKMIELLVKPDRGPVTRRFFKCGQQNVADRGTRPELKERFAGYQPKRTPDTLQDYRPTLAARLAKLPPANPESFQALLTALESQKQLAKKHPGRFEEGNPILGADEKQYHPSDQELVESEIGRRLALAVAASEPGQLAGLKVSSVEYRRISFRHVDVMGSGRFFYASSPVITVIQLIPSK